MCVCHPKMRTALQMQREQHKRSMNVSVVLCRVCASSKIAHKYAHFDGDVVKFRRSHTRSRRAQATKRRNEGRSAARRECVGSHSHTREWLWPQWLTFAHLHLNDGRRRRHTIKFCHAANGQFGLSVIRVGWWVDGRRRNDESVDLDRSNFLLNACDCITSDVRDNPGHYAQFTPTHTQTHRCRCVARASIEKHTHTH